MRLFISAGEPSGDVHAANLIREIGCRRPGITFAGFAGPNMRAAGCESLFDLTTLPIMFFVDAVRKYGQFRGLLRDAAARLDAHPVDAMILIDYPGFHWHLARAAKERGIPVFYYGVPQMWAWAPWRVNKLRRLVDHVLCKLPFESDWFRERKITATWVGHPFFDEVQRQEGSLDLDFAARMRGEGKPLVLLLPGSRNSEVARHWPILRRAAARIADSRPEAGFAVGCYSEPQRREVEADLQRNGMEMEVFAGRTPELIRAATCAIACSGSVSLELLAARLPTVIVYHLNRFYLELARRFLVCRNITLVNLMDGGPIARGRRPLYDPDATGAAPVPMPEYLGCTDRSADIARRVLGWLDDPESLQQARGWLDRIASRHAVPGASGRAAEYVLKHLESSEVAAPARRRAA